MRHTASLLVLALAATAAPQDALAQTSPIERATRKVAEAARTVTRYQGRRDDNRFEQTRRQNDSARIGANGIVELYNVAGAIEITTAPGDTVNIEIVQRARGRSDADAQEQLSLVTVDVIKTPGRMEVRERYPDHRDPNRPRRNNYNLTTTYRVTAPVGTRVKTESISGDVNVRGIRGDLTLGTISGNVTVQDAGRTINGQSISGNVMLISAQPDAVVRLSSTSGNAEARRVQVRSIDLGSVSGNVKGEDLDSERANLHTMSGSVEYHGAFRNGGRYELRSHSGNVRVEVGAGVGFELEASTFSGEVRSNLSLTRQGNVSRRERTVRATYGDGGARVTASTFSGNVVINGR